MLIRWNDVNDKVLNDPTKYQMVNEFVSTPSLSDLSPDLEYFAQRIPYAKPESDYRLEVVDDSWVMTDDVETETGCRYYDVIYTAIPRTTEEKKESVDDLKNQANFGVFPFEKQLEYLAMYIAITRRELHNQNISPEMQNIVDKVDNKITKIWQNHITALGKKQAIDDGLAPLLDDGWEDTDPETEV
jgi:hypothetical protein